MFEYEDKNWCEKMRIRLDFNNVMQNFIDGGFSQKNFDDLSEKITNAANQLDSKRANGQMDWRNLPYNQPVDEILDYAAQVQKNFESIVVLGIGGSALGPIALQQAINHPYYNELPREKRKFPKFYVADNVDPERLVYLFDVIDLDKTLFIVISKSGNTSETMSQFMIIKDMLEKELGKENAKSHIVCITDSEKGNLIKIAKDENYKTFYIPAGVGGRFSQLSPVGLLPAAICGIDIKELLAGAAFMDEACKNNPQKNIAAMYATINYLAMQNGQNITVMMPYADSLKYISDWYAQLWAESLGKSVDNNGKVVNVGQTPVKALGVTDQHSQIQLYNEGPYDKIITFISVENYRETITIPKIFEDMPAVGFLGGATHNELIQVEHYTTERALAKLNRMNMTIILPHINEFVIGQLFYMLEVATAFAGELLNINAFNQPGVEEAKNLTYGVFGKPGYENKRIELENVMKKNQNYFV